MKTLIRHNPDLVVFNTVEIQGGCVFFLSLDLAE